MTAFPWSYVLFGMTLFSQFLMWKVGDGKRWPWLVMAFTFAPTWGAYAIATKQYGFLGTNAVMTGVQLRNYIRAGKRDMAERSEARSQDPQVGTQETT